LLSLFDVCMFVIVMFFVTLLLLLFDVCMLLLCFFLLAFLFQYPEHNPHHWEAYKG
jgi:hypothetical protein